MNDTIIMSAPLVQLTTPSLSKWDREHAAFRRLLPQLLATHRGKYVAIHGEQVVDSGDEELALALRVLAIVGNTDICVGLVSDQPEPICRSGLRREVASLGGYA